MHAEQQAEFNRQLQEEQQKIQAAQTMSNAQFEGREAATAEGKVTEEKKRLLPLEAAMRRMEVIQQQQMAETGEEAHSRQQAADMQEREEREEREESRLHQQAVAAAGVESPSDEVMAAHEDRLARLISTPSNPCPVTESPRPEPDPRVQRLCDTTDK
ncbi:hypothetical protein FBEOM_12594, partial [Fusarium beomiforme]